ncbi:MAG: TonB-dependent receptor [Porticoccaceae bacterium]|nr:TonB-dependent receptor [Porticoccaceae bacterium]
MRRQKDDVYEGSNNYTGYGVTPKGFDPTEVRNAGGEFTSTMPRFIADFKPNEDTTIYVSYAEGTLPGLFNPSLIGLSDSQLAEVAAQTGGADIQVDEEVAENWELGLKRSFLDGRGFVSAAYYSTDLTNVHIPSVAYYTVDGVQTLTGNVTSQGGNAELNGLEVEGTVLLNENLTLGFTYALNDSELGNKFLSGDAKDLLGDNTLAQGNEFSRYPKTSGSLSLDFNKGVEAGDLFARADLIYTGKMYASNAMLAHTGTGQKLNLRVGLDTESYRFELFCTNCFEDEQSKGLQAMWDLSGISGEMGGGATAAGPRVLTVSLPDKRVFGVRASFNF